MKRDWDIEELDEQFALSSSEIALLHGKVEYNQLGLAVLLKYFQYEGSFPRHKRDIPRAVVDFVAQQLGVDVSVFDQYDLAGRTISDDRTAIRRYLDFREATEDDRAILKEWLISHPDLSHEQSVDYWLNMAYSHCKDRHVEPFSRDQMERLVRSVLDTYQESLCDVIYRRLSDDTKTHLAELLEPDPSTPVESENPWSRLAVLKEDPAGVNLKNILEAGEKLRQLWDIGLPANVFENVGQTWIEVYRQRASIEHPSDLAEHPVPVKFTFLAAFCFVRQAEITDQMVDLLIGIIHKISTRSKRKLDKIVVKDIERVYGKSHMLFKIAKASLAEPDGSVEEVIYSVVSPAILKRIVDENEAQPLTYVQHLGQVMRRSYGSYYRRMLAAILDILRFRSNNLAHRPVLRALKVVEKYLTHRNLPLYPLDEVVPWEGVVPAGWREVVVVKQGTEQRVSRLDYELCVLGTLRNRLRATEIWVEGARKYGNPDQVLPTDFLDKRDQYYQDLELPLSAQVFVERLKAQLRQALTDLNASVPKNPYVKILAKKNGWIRLSPLPPQEEAPFLPSLKAEVGRQWPATNLLDMLKEADLRVHFTGEFKTLAQRQVLDAPTLWKRLLLCLFGLGTNIGLKQASTGDKEQSHKDLLYVKGHFLSREALRSANAKLVNATLAVRLPHIWGEGSTACASDSRKFGVRGENLKSEWHTRYRGRGVMVYWHVERKALAIYSQLNAPSTSEVASMIEGVLRHATTMQVERNYVDTHGQSEIAFAFCHLMGFELLPRLKNLAHQKLTPPDEETFANLEPILTKPLNWRLVEQQYDLMVQYAAALRLGNSDADTILKRFTQTEVQHPMYAALAELGKALKTLFLCQYLSSEALRREIEEGLNVIENWNSANAFLGYGKSGEFSGRRLLDQELSMLSLQLLQNALIYVNTLMPQQVLSNPYYLNRMKEADWRAMTPLIYAHINPYGTFKLNMKKRIPLQAAA